MAIQFIPDILINGSNKAYGGYIYNANLNIKKITEPAEITLSFINETKNYITPTLSLSIPYSIQVGNIYSDTFYAIKSKTSDSSQGKVLNVTYWNGAIILNQFWVGLYKQMGSADDSQNPNSLIIVGKELHPCDVNEDGVFDSLDVSLLKYDQNDPCELRCPNDIITNQFIINECAEKFVTQLFDVAYSFGDLITAIKNKGIGLGTVPVVTNPKYLAKYTGKLKSVLDSWCSDMGWTYFFEKGTLNFLDVRTRPIVNLQPFSNLVAEEIEQTLEGTISRGFITYFAEPGVYGPSCPNSQPYNLFCLTLRELFGSFYTPNSNPMVATQADLQKFADIATANSNQDLVNSYKDDVFKQGVPIVNFELSCIFSFYDENLRNMSNFWEYYGIHNDSAAQQLVGKNLDRLGQMKILQVFSPGINTNAYNNLLNGVMSDGTTIFNPSQPEIKNNFTANGGYFALVIQNNDLLKKQFDIEQRLARDFIGMHWMRVFSSPYIGDNPQITPQGTYYAALSAAINQIPFAQFNHTNTSYVGQLVQTFANKQANDFRVYNSQRFTAFQDLSTTINAQTNTTILRSIIYMAKNTVWYPTPIDSADFKNIVNATPYMAAFGVDPNLLKNDFGTLQSLVDFSQISSTDFPNVKLMAFFPGKLAVDTATIDNPAEENPFYKPGVAQYAIAGYGLSSKSCYRVTVNGFPIYMPAASSVNFGAQEQFNGFSILDRGGEDEAFGVTAPTYQVYVTITNKNRGIIPKIQSTYVTAPPNATQALEIDYVVKDINRNSLKYFVAPLAPICSVDSTLLKAAHQEINVNLNYSVIAPFSTFDYTIAGLSLSSPVSIADGLQEMNISISDSEVVTKIRIGDSLFKPPSVEYLLNQFQQMRTNAVENGRLNPLGT